MKYQIEVEVNATRDEMIALFDNSENLKEWMPNLVSFEHLSGEPRHVGAQSKFVVSHGKSSCELIETVTVRELPVRFEGTYETKGMWNEVKNEFIEIDNSSTRWIAHSEFKSDKLMMKLMMILMPGAFKKESLKFMNSFKEFAESQNK
ncbi:SRPBCC family protein [Glaciecola sp. MF2-115]|uniref:SRPBCC family protein n=1 Tax=Glaciecola sp. MF2-115 TaxID=3384827 RepID=UPI0039A1FBF8